MNIDDAELVSANWTLATNDDNVANSKRLIWIGEYCRGYHVSSWTDSLSAHVDKLIVK